MNIQKKMNNQIKGHSVFRETILNHVGIMMNPYLKQFSQQIHEAIAHHFGYIRLGKRR